MPDKRPFIRDAVLAGLAAGAATAFADAALWIRAGGSDFVEYALRPYGILHLPLSGYALVFFVLAGLLIGLGIGILERFLIRTPAPWNRTVDTIASLGFLILLAGVLRARMSDEMGLFSRYLLGKAALAVVLFLAAGVFLAHRARKRSGERRTWRLALIGSFVLAAVIFAAPVLDGLRLPRHKVPGPRPGRPNILFLVLDTLRADALSALNPNAAPTPAMDRMAAQGLLFRRAIAPASWTLPSHASLFTGLSLTQHGADFSRQALDPGFPALAEILINAGYQTAAFSENPNITRSNGFSRGFTDFGEPFLYGRAGLLPALIEKALARWAGRYPTGEETEETLGGLVRWMRASALQPDSPPFFAFVNLMAAHLPNWPRKGFSETPADAALLRRLRPVNGSAELNYLPSHKLTSAEMDALREFYRGDVAYLDACLERLFRFLESSGLLDDTVLVITSDHGENFGEHGLIEHAYCLYNTVVHVPLIVRYPARIPAGGVRSEPVATIGLFGTLLDLAGVSESRRPAGSPRIVLQPGDSGGDVFSESENCVGMIHSVLDREPEGPGFDYRPYDRALSCVYSGDRKLILGSDGRVELYDLSADWAERNDLAAAEPAAVTRLLKKLADWRAGLKAPAFVRPAPDVPRGVKDALKSLGYIR